MSALAIGARCPDFALPGTDGKTHALADLRGKLLVVIVSCNHCPYVASPDLQNALEALLAGTAPNIAETTAIGCSVKWK